jgi:hypothetical protein
VPKGEAAVEEETKEPKRGKAREFRDKEGRTHQEFQPQKHFNKDSHLFKTKILNYHNNFARLKQIQRIWAVLERRSGKDENASDVNYHHIVEIYESDIHSLAVLFQFFAENDLHRFACDLYRQFKRRFETEEESKLCYNETIKTMYAHLLGFTIPADDPNAEIVPAPDKVKFLDAVPKLVDKFGGGEKYISLKEHGITERDVHFIDQPGVPLDEAFEHLNFSDIVALDIKLTHYSVHAKKVKPCLLQMGTRTKVYIFDLKALKKFGEETLPFGTKVQAILQNRNIIKIMFDFEEDYKYLTEDPFGTQYFTTFKNSLDLHFEKEVPRHDGLKDLLESFFGKSIDKSELISNWERKPLRKAQLYYAASELIALIMLFDKIYKEDFALVKQPPPPRKAK